MKLNRRDIALRTAQCVGKRLRSREQISKADRERAKQASRSLYTALGDLITQRQNWTKKEETQAEVEVLILDSVFASLPIRPSQMTIRLGWPSRFINTAKHCAFTRCGEMNLYGIVDAQVELLERELFTENSNLS